MNELVVDSTELEFMPDVTKASEGVVAELESASLLEAIQVRKLTLMPLMRENLQSRSSYRWGINE